MIKTLSKLEIQGIIHNLIIGTYQKKQMKNPPRRHNTKGQKTEDFLPKIKDKARMSIFTIFIQHHAGGTDWKKAINLS